MFWEIVILVSAIPFCLALMAIGLYSLDNIVSFIREELWGEQPYEDRVKSWLKKK